MLNGNYKEDYIVKGLVTILVIMLNLNMLISPWNKDTKTMHVQPDIAQNNVDSNYKVSETF